MFDAIKNLFKKPETVIEKVEEKKLTDKEIATAKKEAYIKVIDTQFDPNNPANGFFELDWTEYFILDLKRAGYNGATDEEIVDKWFNAICQNVIDETRSKQEVRIV